ncbi:MAG: DUF222 domain-containing protein, partial [Gemmatimonadota bacterium]
MMYAVAEMYAVGATHAGPEMDPEEVFYTRRRIDAPRGIYAERGAPPRWPRLVREAAVDDRWYERPVAHFEDADTRPEAADTRPEAADTADPLTDPEDELFLLGERCAQAYMQADAMHYHAMKLLAEFDRRRGWEDSGFSSTAEWLAWRIGIKAGAARERVRTALALEALPPDLRGHAKWR